VVWEGRSREAPPYPDQSRFRRLGTLSGQSMLLGLEARNGRAVHNYGNGPGTTRPALA
jgi:hypothetical protein